MVSPGVAAVMTFFIPMFGLFIARLMLGDLSSYAWTYIPIFWVPPFSAVPAYLMWTEKIPAKEEPPKEPFGTYLPNKCNCQY